MTPLAKLAALFMLLITAGGLVYFLYNLSAGRPKKQPESAVKSATTILLTDLKGEPVPLDKFKGRIVFLNFWATWCKPCLGEIPSIQKIQRTFLRKDIVFLFASNERVEEIEAFKRSRFPDLEFLRIANFEDQNIQALPATYIFNDAGGIIFSDTGYRNWSDSNNVALIKKIINER